MLSKRQRPYDLESLAPSRRLRRNVQDLASSNELASSRIHELVADVNRVAPTELADLSRPTAKKNCARFLRRRFLKRKAWMPDYVVSLRTWSPRHQKIVKEDVPMQLIHEIVAVLLKHGSIDKLMSSENMDPLSKEHLLHCETSAMCKLLGIGLWGDGAPTQWDRSESIDVISMSLPGSKGFKNLRIPLLAIPHSRTCTETWEDIFAVVEWSLIVLATGVWPTCRHDGTPWQKSNSCRKAPRRIIRGALVEVRQAWKFLAEVFGFPAHNQ